MLLRLANSIEYETALLVLHMSADQPRAVMPRTDKPKPNNRP